MATEKLTLSKKLSVNVVSTEVKGETSSEVEKALTFSRIKTSATDDQLLAAGNAIAELQTDDLSSVTVTETCKLSSGE